MKNAIFLDKDGTIIQNLPYNIHPDFIHIEKETVQGLQLLQSLGFSFVVVTNQSGIAKGFFSENDFYKHLEYMQNLFAKNGIYFSGIYFCPHDKNGSNEKYRKDCLCRKPKNGMLRKAIQDLRIAPESSWMIGDILNDIEAGNSVSLQTILIDNGNETEWVVNARRKPHFTVDNFLQAAYIIAKQLQTRITYGR